MGDDARRLMDIEAATTRLIGIGKSLPNAEDREAVGRVLAELGRACYCCGPGQCQGGCQCYARVPRPDHADPDHPDGDGLPPLQPGQCPAYREHGLSCGEAAGHAGPHHDRGPFASGGGG